MKRAIAALVASVSAAMGCEVPIEFRSRTDSSTAQDTRDGTVDDRPDPIDVIERDSVDDIVTMDRPVLDVPDDTTVRDVVPDRASPCSVDSDCGAGRRCTAGMCVSSCVVMTEQCNGRDDDCDGSIDEDDPMAPLCASGQACRAGACVSGGCPAGTTMCAGACVNLASDARNCGACGNACPAGQRCATGACVP
jgi:hypothetical protein